MPDVMNAVEAAEALGLCADAGGLNGSHFPGAFRTPLGEWMFTTAEVLALRAVIDRVDRELAEEDAAAR